jgi:triosephosphate isomerase
VFAQHVDGVDFGSHTGKTPPQLAQRLGASGTLLNHSENRFSDFALLEKAIIKAKQAGLFVVVCAESSQEGAEIMSKYRPDLIAVEPPELIGGDISVSTAQPELITDSVRRIGRKKVLVGAGVKNAQDVKIALELGAVGILVASGITKVHDPESALLDLIAGMSGAQA